MIKLIKLLQLEMTKPTMYGWFHLSWLIIAVILLVFLGLKHKYSEKNLKVVFEKRDDENYLECPVEKPIRMSTEKLESLGWKPKFSIEEGFKLTIDFFESIKKN